jgi:hypothetical protein
MGDTPEEKFEQISRAVQESILKNYPNPERRGCPGDEAVRSVAARTQLTADETWEHITHCSPCYAEFLAYKEQFRNVRRREVRLRRRTFIGIAAAAAVVGPVLWVSRHNEPSGDVIMAEWDLERYAPSRGLDDDPDRPPFRAPLKRGRVRARLPRGTDEGTYEIEIRRTEEGSALKRATGMARIVDGHTLLPFEIDLSDLPSGSYFAAIGGRGKSWRVQPLLLQ